MDAEDKSLLIFSVLGVVTGIYWMIYVLDPSNVLIVRVGLALQGAWVIGDFLVILTILAGGVHLWHRRG